LTSSTPLRNLNPSEDCAVTDTATAATTASAASSGWIRMAALNWTP